MTHNDFPRQELEQGFEEIKQVLDELKEHPDIVDPEVIDDVLEKMKEIRDAPI